MSLPFELLPEQEDGINKLASNKRFFLFDEPGFGKTVQSILAADAVGAREVLVVCPANVAPQWHRQIKRLSQTNFNAKVVSYEKAQRIDKRAASKFHALIIDEGHYLKNHKAKRTQHIFGRKADGGGMVESIPYVWELTGSPAPNNYSELWSQIRALTPQAIKQASGAVMTYWQFVDKFCVVGNNGFADVIVGNKNAELLRERMNPFMLRRMRGARNVVVDDLVVSSRAALSGLKEIESSDIAEQIADVLRREGVERLNKVAANASALRRYTGIAKITPTVNVIKEELEGGLKKIVVVAYHREVIQGMQKELSAAGIGNSVLIGGMTEKQSEVAKETFIKNPDCKVIIGQITKAGTGTDGLQDVCKDMLIVESSWVPEENKQVIARLDRRGQAEGVLVRFVSLEGSLDEKISASVRRKTQDILKLLN